MVTLIFCGDLKYCPYLSRYIERLEEKKEAYEVLFWNRGNFKLTVPENYFFYNKPSSENLNKINKAMDFFKYRQWIKRHITESKPDKLILLSSLTGVLLFDIIRKYKKKYVFDIRDYSYENIKLFRIIEKKIIDNSSFTAISSKGFQAFLPKHDYVIAHNFNRNEMVEGVKFIKQKEPLKFVWNGTVRFFDFQKKYIDALSNDSRFQIVYHGAGTDLEKYQQYCQKNNVENVVFTGPYDNKEKEKLLEGTAILNNCYGGRDGDQLKYAISNRYYDGLIYCIPQLVEPGGYKATVTENNEVGISLNADESFADKLYEYYTDLSQEMFEQACKKVIGEVICEDNNYIHKIDTFIIG